VIKVQNLRKVFRVHKREPGLTSSIRALFRREWIEKVAVSGSTFSVAEGEIVGLIGANGAGKTTLLKMLSGIIHPTSGEARVLGSIPWKRENSFRTQIALIMGQKAQLWWDLPAADCFLLLREIYRIPEDRYRKNLGRLISMLNIGNEMNVQIRRLSLGERMKMELIAALLHSPRVVFLDEPTIGLDLTTQRAIRDFILEYRAELSPAMLLTSHYMEDIQRLCKRIIILREGSIVYDGSLRRVIEEYAPYKEILVHLRRGIGAVPDAEDLSRLGDVVECSETQVKIRAPRDQIADAANELLQRFSVADLSIDEPEIGDTIERIMAGRPEEPR